MWVVKRPRQTNADSHSKELRGDQMEAIKELSEFEAVTFFLVSALTSRSIAKAL